MTMDVISLMASLSVGAHALIMQCRSVIGQSSSAKTSSHVTKRKHERYERVESNGEIKPNPMYEGRELKLIILK